MFDKNSRGKMLLCPNNFCCNLSISRRRDEGHEEEYFVLIDSIFSKLKVVGAITLRPEQILKDMRVVNHEHMRHRAVGESEKLRRSHRRETTG